MQSILVPLDGSRRAEEAIPVALVIAARHKARVEFVTVQQPIAPYRAHGAPPYEPKLDAEFREERRHYLNAVAESARQRSHVDAGVCELEEPVVESLARHITSTSPDLVVMTTAGEGGFGACLMGSVADGLVRQVDVPVLLVQPDLANPRGLAPNAVGRVLVPLDGSPFSEEILEHAVKVAGENAEYELLCIVRLLVPEALIPRATAAAQEELEPERARLAAHLERLADQLRARGLRVKTTTLLHPRPAQAILEHAANSQADLIAMTTHGYGAVGRFLIGSVAHRVLHAGKVAVLLQRPQPAAT